jgi:hypothetical protein
MISSLVGSKAKQAVWTLGHITPIYIEFFETWLLHPRRRLFFFDKLHLILIFTDISDNVILAVTDIYY